jgi:adenylate cyclase
MDAAQHAFVAATYASLGDRTAAAAHYEQMVTLDPGLSMEGFLATLHYGNETDLAHIRAGLTMAEAAHGGQAVAVT